MIRGAAVRSLDRAALRLSAALPDLAALESLQTAAPRTGTLAALQREAQAAANAIAAQADALRRKSVSPEIETRSASALAAAAAQLRSGAGQIASLISQRPPVAPAPATQRDGDLSDTAEFVAIAAERLATVAAAALQAASVRVPEMPQPTPRELLAAYVQQNAIFFSNNEDYRDPKLAEAVLDTVVRLARQSNVLIRVIGYTDERGGQTRNNALSQSRADKVAQALAERGLRRYYQTAFDDGYVPRVMPYVWRIIWTVGGLMAVTAVLPTNTGRPAFDALVVFSTWYPIGVMLLVFASWPLGRLIRQRAQERRK